jgi:hypothetical protein
MQIMEPPGIGLTGLDRVGFALGIGLDPGQRWQITRKGNSLEPLSN